MHERHQRLETPMEQLEAVAGARLPGSHEPCACVRSARALVTWLQASQADEITLDALALADRALAVAERRMSERQRRGRLP